jgi:UDP-N-acetylmuramoylalanine--D-glutamate ligase
MQLAGKKVVVVGLGKSGIAAAGMLQKLAARVVATDIKPKERLSGVDSLLEEGIELILGAHPPELLAGAALVVLSPGVPANIPFLEEARRRGIQIWSEMELAFRLCKAPLLAITGANGKTTTTAWLEEMLKADGKKVVVAGNIGTPLTAVVEEVTTAHLVVVEISSFQLEGTIEFRPRVAALLNLTADHLDRHGSFTAYTDAKARIFANQGPDDYCILNADDEEVRKLGEKVPGKLLWFSRYRELGEGAFIRNNRLVIRDSCGFGELCPIEDLSLPGEHNVENALAASLMAHLMGVSAEVIARVLKNFAGIEHRCETIATQAGVRFVNDSKGTNPEAAIKALRAFGEPLILIAGGRAKGSDFSGLAAVIKERVKKVILLGEAAPLLRESLARIGYLSVLEVPTLVEAVDTAFAAAVSGDCILLSPACASWDMFSNYEERGRAFREAVAQLGRRGNDK